MHELTMNTVYKTTLRCFINDVRISKKIKWFNLDIQCIKDQNGSLTGFLALAREDPTLTNFQQRYGITGRQAEIILHVIKGLSNRETGERLGISERTVENHMFNIYNKIGVDNRIELLNKAVKYGLLPE